LRGKWGFRRNRLIPLGRQTARQAAFTGVRELIRRNSRMRCLTYPSSVKCAEATALRLVTTI
jgi:hypothetical protein